MAQLSDRWGEPLTTCQRDAGEIFSNGVEALAGLQGDVVSLARAACEADPTFVLALCLDAYSRLYAMTGDSMRVVAEIIRHLEQLEDVSDDRSKFHIGAIRSWQSGNLTEAHTKLQNLLRVYPRDLLAAKVAQDLCLFIGDSVGLLNVAKKTLSQWDETLARFDIILGMHSFGLEETYEFSSADEAGRAALDLAPYNTYARHSIAHVYEMNGRKADGIYYMEHTKEYWSQSSSAIHMWWHLALLYLDSTMYDEAIAVYDLHLCHNRPGTMHDITDRASILWRLHLLGYSLADRATDLMADAEIYLGDSLYVFNELHLIMVSLLVNDIQGVEKILNYMESRGNAWSDLTVVREVGKPVGEALYDFARGEYQSSASSLSSLRYLIRWIGGSHAQRDVFQETALSAAAAAGDLNLLNALKFERLSTRSSTDRSTERLIARGRLRSWE